LSPEECRQWTAILRSLYLNRACPSTRRSIRESSNMSRLCNCPGDCLVSRRLRRCTRRRSDWRWCREPTCNWLLTGKECPELCKLCTTTSLKLFLFAFAFAPNYLGLATLVLNFHFPIRFIVSPTLIAIPLHIILSYIQPPLFQSLLLSFLLHTFSVLISIVSVLHSLKNMLKPS